MALEIERKYLGVDFANLERALIAFGAENLGTHFESNIVYDTPQFSLYSSGRLLRVRSQEWRDHTRHLLTLKLEADAATVGPCKAREERELSVESAIGIGSVLEGLGYTIAIRYEKVRSVWRTARIAGISHEVLVELDELPFAKVVEIEGEPEAIDAVAVLLGLDKCEISTKSYHALHQEWRRARGLSPEWSFIFEKEKRLYLRRHLGLSADADECF